VNVAAAQAASIALQEQAQCPGERTAQRRPTSGILQSGQCPNAALVDSHTNFILLNAGRSGNDAAEHFRKNNIRVMSGIPSMKDYVRVSLGTPEQMKEFWRVWDLMPVHSMHM